MTIVPVYCTATFPDGKPCHALWEDHVHQPTPCRNGQDERHHDFLPPKTVAVLVNGQRRRVKVSA